MAAPLVAGAWSLLRQAAPDATVDQILAALQSTGLPVTDMRRLGGIETKPRVQVFPALTALDAPGASRPKSLSSPSSRGLQLPVAITHAGDGSGRLFITEQCGKIRVFDGTTLLPTPFLDLTGKVTCAGERGLLSVAFHPDYATLSPSKGFFYVYFTNLAGNIVIKRFSVSPSNPDLAAPGSGFLILKIPAPRPREPQRRPAPVRSGRLSLRRGRGRRGHRRPREQRAEPRRPPRQTAAARRGWRGPLRDSAVQSLRGCAGGAAGDLGIRPPEPVALQLRPPDRRPLHRRRRPGHEGGDQPPAGGQRGGDYGWPCMEGTAPFTRPTRRPSATDRSPCPCSSTGTTPASAPSREATGTGVRHLPAIRPVRVRRPLQGEDAGRQAGQPMGQDPAARLDALDQCVWRGRGPRALRGGPRRRGRLSHRPGTMKGPIPSR